MGGGGRGEELPDWLLKGGREGWVVVVVVVVVVRGGGEGDAEEKWGVRVDALHTQAARLGP